MIVASVRDAYESRRPLRVAGVGTWLRAGHPTSSSELLSLAGHRGIVEYVPGDLTLTARAGTPLHELIAAVKAEGQWLPLDPWGGDAGSLGATVSTATPGPHSHSMGLPRDVVLGLEFVSGAGQTIRVGGRVVKNVAGFDLTRLLIGSWGSLGVITEVTVRLRARPEQTRTLALDVQPTAAALSDLAVRLRSLPFTPFASELVDPVLASRLGFTSRVTLLLRIGGNAHSMRGQLAALNGLGSLRDANANVWHALRGCDGNATASWRVSQLPSAFGSTWEAAAQSTRELPLLMMHGNPARGVVRVIADGDERKLARAAMAFSGTVQIEVLPANAWAFVEPRPEAALSRALRDRFDPGRILNPGIMGGLP